MQYTNTSFDLIGLSFSFVFGEDNRETSEYAGWFGVVAFPISGSLPAAHASFQFWAYCKTREALSRRSVVTETVSHIPARINSID